MIELTSISKSFGEVQAVEDLSFEVAPGEVVGLLGPNGAGKTTTMRMISGFFSPDSGKIVMNGRPLSLSTSSLEKYRKMGYLPENNPLYKDMLVSEIFDFAADMQSIDKQTKDARIAEIATSVGIEDTFSSPIRSLSKGYKQRLGIALSLLHQPDILILDEPTEGLDPNQREDIRDLIRNFGKDKTVFISTHVLSEALAVCTRLLIMHKGKLVADGSPETLLSESHGEKVYLLGIEGEQVAESLEKLSGITSFAIVHEKGQRKEMKVTTELDISLEPEISKLAKKYDWTIWTLREKEHSLEDVFAKLTT